MHSFETNSSNVPAFLIKLWKLVEDPSCNDLIAWSDSGLSFIIKDQTRFSKELLPQYFKHNNMASFIRQLNMYGFRKVMNYEKSGLRNENEEMEFQHSFFAKDQLSLLAHIKRKIPNTKVSEPAVKSSGRDILTDLSSIREKQENMDNMLLKMKQENELLWRELTNMRKKHKAQEHVIQKVIQFLVSIVQRSNQNIGVQRKIPRMLHDGSGNQEKSQVSGTIDVLRNKNQNYITVPADKVISPLGPVIQEVNDFEHDLDLGKTSPCVKSPEDKTENSACHTTNQDSENQESDCPLISSLNSPINTSATMEPLSILEPLHPRTPVLNSDGVVEESVLGIPLEYISASPSNVISIPEEEPCDNIISLPDTNSDVAVTYSFGSSPNMLEYPSSKSDFEDPFLSSESLQTPKIPTIHIEDIVAPDTQSTKKNYSLVKSTSKSKSGVQKQSEQQPQKKQQEIEHNYQLSVPDSTDVVKSQSLTNEENRCSNLISNSEMRLYTSHPAQPRRNTFSNHVLSVEEELNSLYKQISSCGAWNIDDANKLLGVSSDDANKLLGLFSTDDAASNETLAGELAGQAAIKTEPVDIVGNELVHFTPSMLEVGLDYGNLECLIQDTNNPLEDLNKDSENQKNFLGDVLIDVDQATASEAAEFLLNNGSNNKLKSPRRPRIQKIQKAKRRKIK